MALSALLALCWLSVWCRASPEGAPSWHQVPMNAVIGNEPFKAPIDWFDPPSLDATGHHIFNSISSLTLRWPNTMWKNGHTIAPGTIPFGTTLYHGTVINDGSLPRGADWLGFDFSTGYMYCGYPCRVATFTATRDLKVLYFDGLSAAKTPHMNTGHMDTQDLLTWGEVRRDRDAVEWDVIRIKVLCEWGREFGIDGFVRMQWNYELMYCDFNNGLDLVEFSEYVPTLHSLVHEREPDPPEGWKGDLIDGAHAFVNCFLDAQRYDRVGEQRVKVDYSRAVSFYDPAVSSLIEARHGQPRTRHSIAGISKDDVSSKLDELRNVLRREESRSGIDWSSVFSVVFDHYTDRLQTLNHTLSLPDTNLSHLKNVRQQVLSLVLPYIRPADVPSMPGNISWAAPIVERCSHSPVAHVPLELFTPQERLIRGAIEEMLHEICRRLVLVWVHVFDVEDLGNRQIKFKLVSSRSHVSDLIRWLDWANFNRCNPACALGQFCYISMWPLPFPGDTLDNITPRCVSQNFAQWPQPL